MQVINSQVWVSRCGPHSVHSGSQRCTAICANIPIVTGITFFTPTNKNVSHFCVNCVLGTSEEDEVGAGCLLKMSIPPQSDFDLSN
jgi:hypothetical protein